MKMTGVCPIGCSIGLLMFLSVPALANELIDYVAKLHENVCSPHITCLQGERVDQDGTSCCGYCDCDIDCFTYGSCCPRMYDSYLHGNKIVSQSRYECIEPQYLPKSKTNFTSNFRYWMVTKCSSIPRNADEERIRELCENHGLDGNLESIEPASDISFTTHYRNKYCAFCNKQYSINIDEKWDPEIHCNDILSLNDRNLLKTIEEKRCNVIYRKPANAVIRNCFVPPYTITTCNETGHWPVYEKIIDLACNLFIDPFNATYKNYFCYICNRKDFLYPDDWICELYQNTIVNVSPRFFTLLDIGLVERARDDSPKLNCDTETQFEDRKLLKCRDKLCNKNLHLKNDRCHVIDGVRLDACHEFFMKITPSEGINTTLLGVFIEQLETILNIDTPALHYMRLIYISFSHTSSIEYSLYHMVADFGYTNSMIRVQELHNKQFPISINGSDVGLKIEIDMYNVTIQNMYNKIFVTNPADTSEVKVVRTNRSFDNTVVCPGKTIRQFNKLLYSPFIELTFDELSMSVINSFLILKRNFDTIKSFLVWEYMLSEGGVFISLEDYKSIYPALPDVYVAVETQRTHLIKKVDAKGILTFVCVCLSMTCLLATILIYFRFPELRTQPGVNNIILCVCLLCAQALYQFGAGQPNLSYVACSFVGTVCHFLWLTVMFSMNFCSFQMFIIFRSHTKLLSTYSTRKTLTAVLYIVCSSFVFVAINLVVSLSRSHGDNSGYGGVVCFIKSYEMHLFTFIIPSFILIIINICLFAFVINRMRKFNIISSKLNHERNYLGINARLSTLTGLTWVFGFLQIFARHDIIEYLFIIFNASQGVFIMIAFVCNQRVYSLIFGTRLQSSKNGVVVTEKTSVQK